MEKLCRLAALNALQRDADDAAARQLTPRDFFAVCIRGRGKGKGKGKGKEGWGGRERARERERDWIQGCAASEQERERVRESLLGCAVFGCKLHEVHKVSSHPHR